MDEIYFDCGAFFIEKLCLIHSPFAVEVAAFVIAFFLRSRHQVGEAIDHHGGLGDDADDDAQDVYFGRDEVMSQEIPDGVDAQRDVDQDRGHESWVVFSSEDKEHHDVG